MKNGRQPWRLILKLWAEGVRMNPCWSWKKYFILTKCLDNQNRWKLSSTCFLLLIFFDFLLVDCPRILEYGCEFINVGLIKDLWLALINNQIAITNIDNLKFAQLPGCEFFPCFRSKFSGSQGFADKDGQGIPGQLDSKVPFQGKFHP